MTEQSRKTSLDPAVRRLLMFLICVWIFEVLLIAVAPRLHSGSVLKIAKDSMLLRVRTDSWADMARGEQAWRRHSNAVYETTFFEHNIRFIYPPTSLLIFEGWQMAPFLHVRPFVAFKFTLLLSLLGTWAVAEQFFLLLFPVNRFSAVDRWTIRLIIAALIVSFLPLINAFFLGQVQTIINVLLTASAYLWLRGRRVVPGIFLGACCWFKPQLALFLIWGMLRRKWSFAAALASMLVLAAAISVAVFGFHNTAEYLNVLHFLSRRGDALFTNQSLNGLLHRQMHVGSPVTWVYGYPPYNRTIYLATLISSALLLVVALVVPAARGWNGTTLDFLVFAMAAMMASPIAWEHHYGVFFLVFLMWMPAAVRRLTIFAVVLGMYLLMTDNWAPVTLLMYSPWTFAISHVYFGGLLLFAWTLFRGDSLETVCRRDEFR